MADPGMVSFEALGALAEKLAAKRDRLFQQLQDVEKEIEAVNTTLRLIRSNRLIPGEEQRFVEVDIAELQGKPIEAALVIIAQHNDRLLRVKFAKDLLLKAGVLKDSKHAAASIYTAIGRSEKWEKVESGLYRLLVPEQQKQPNVEQSALRQNLIEQRMLELTLANFWARQSLNANTGTPVTHLHKGMTFEAQTVAVDGGWYPIAIVHPSADTERRLSGEKHLCATREEAEKAAIKGAVRWIDSQSEKKPAA